MPETTGSKRGKSLQAQHIYNIAGADVKSRVTIAQITDGFSLSIDRLPKGIYIVDLLQNNRRKTVTFVRQ